MYILAFVLLQTVPTSFGLYSEAFFVRRNCSQQNAIYPSVFIIFSVSGFSQPYYLFWCIKHFGLFLNNDSKSKFRSLFATNTLTCICSNIDSIFRVPYVKRKKRNHYKITLLSVWLSDCLSVCLSVKTLYFINEWNCRYTQVDGPVKCWKKSNL